MTTFEQVRKMLASQLKIDENSISEDADMISDLKADSLDMFYLVMSLEEEYGITLSDDDAAKLKKVSDVVGFIDGLKK